MTDITTTLNEPVFERLCRDLKVPRPTVRFQPTKEKRDGKNIGGVYTAPSLITIYVGWDQFANDRLIAAMSEAGRVLLHEMRHHWQWHHDQALFNGDIVKCERDAMAFEDRLADYRGIVRIKRTPVGSTPFSRFASKESAVRQQV